MVALFRHIVLWTLVFLFAADGSAQSFGSGDGPRASPPVRIYLANDDHTDYLWAADEGSYARVFVETLDFHLKLADETARNPPAYRNRFNTDGSYWLCCYQQAKTPAEFDRLMARIKDGTISAPLNTLVSCYGGQPAEAVLRGMYYAGRIERQYGVRFPMAVAMENQTLPLGLASLFAGAGAKYSWRGVCGCASRLPNKLLGARPREIYWYTGHDGQRLLMKWHPLVPAEPGELHRGPAGQRRAQEADRTDRHPGPGRV